MRLNHPVSVVLVAVSLTLIAAVMPLGGVAAGTATLTDHLPMLRHPASPAWAHSAIAASVSREPSKPPPGAVSTGTPSRHGQGSVAADARSTTLDPPTSRSTSMMPHTSGAAALVSVGVPTPPPRDA